MSTYVRGRTEHLRAPRSRDPHVDRLAVGYAVDGRLPWGRLTLAERRAVIAELDRREDWHAPRIARHLGVTGRTVQRHRAQMRAVA